jgi:precorrin-2 methylase
MQRQHVINTSVEPSWRSRLVSVCGISTQFDLVCLGTSIHGLGACTIEAIAYLTCADVVYHYPLTTAHEVSMRLLNPHVVNLNDHHYVPGADFMAAYDAIVNEVMDVVKNGKKVAYATQGSPAFHCWTARRLHRRARTEGFRAIMLPGVSSLELISAELVTEYDITSMQMYSVTRLMEGKLAIDSRVPCLLFDMGRYALPAVRQSARSFLQPELAALTKHLGAIYPPDHQFVLMYVGNVGCCQRITATSQSLAEDLLKFKAGVTMFIPAVQSRCPQRAATVA